MHVVPRLSHNLERRVCSFSEAESGSKVSWKCISVALVQIRTGSGLDQTIKLTKPDLPKLIGLEDPG